MTCGASQFLCLQRSGATFIVFLSPLNSFNYVSLCVQVHKIVSAKQSAFVGGEEEQEEETITDTGCLPFAICSE